MNDPFDLERFVRAQDGVLQGALAELRRGRKEGHWMWFVFPQLRGLGLSTTARRYGIGGREEAAAFLAHPILGPRLAECVQTTLDGSERSADRIFGYPDTLKFRSCLTLFAEEAEPGSVFELALDHFFSGERDAETLRRLHIQDA